MMFNPEKRKYLVSKIGEERTAQIELGLEEASRKAKAAGIAYKDLTPAQQALHDALVGGGVFDSLVDPLIAKIEALEARLAKGTVKATAERKEKEKETEDVIDTWTKELHQPGGSAGGYAADLIGGGLRGQGGG